mmetsp:Transcript_19720/g.57211  ORF Transcript_19720/g.57211 Transcript_19720/m.57211 type:complete len:331 (-) Transcript_19720:464-1456(-)
MGPGLADLEAELLLKIGRQLFLARSSESRKGQKRIDDAFCDRIQATGDLFSFRLWPQCSLQRLKLVPEDAAVLEKLRILSQALFRFCELHLCPRRRETIKHELKHISRIGGLHLPLALCNLLWLLHLLRCNLLVQAQFPRREFLLPRLQPPSAILALLHDPRGLRLLLLGLQKHCARLLLRGFQLLLSGAVAAGLLVLRLPLCLPALLESLDLFSVAPPLLVEVSSVPRQLSGLLVQVPLHLLKLSAQLVPIQLLINPGTVRDQSLVILPELFDLFNKPCPLLLHVLRGGLKLNATLLDLLARGGVLPEAEFEPLPEQLRLAAVLQVAPL